MDKETLSNYGWIVICVLVLAVMIALAGPFGTFVAGAIKSTTAGLFGVNQNALGAAGITIDDQAFADGGNGGAGDQGETNTLPEVGKTAEEYTWAEIKAISEAGKGDEYFNLGDTKTFTTTNGIEVVMEIVAFNADTKADGTGTAGITWVSKNIVARHVINLHDTNAGGWKACEMRTWLQNDFYNTIPEDITNIIESVDKTYWDYETKTTLVCSDNVWIPSYRELLGGSTYEDSGATYSSYYSQFPNYKKYYNGTASYWWMRSANSMYSTKFNHFSEAGGAAYTHNTGATLGVVPGFCT